MLHNSSYTLLAPLGLPHDEVQPNSVDAFYYVQIDEGKARRLFGTLLDLIMNLSD